VNDSNFLKEIGRSYIVSAFIPAAIFILLGYFLFNAFIPASFINQNAGNSLFTGYQWVILFLVTLWVAFYLFSADDVTVRIFEGYFFPEWLKKSLIEKQQLEFDEKQLKHYNAWLQLEQSLAEQVAKYGMVDDGDRKQQMLNYLNAQSELANVGLRYPIDKQHLMPTRLGNVLRASEMYAYERYAIGEITIWPRLAPLLPADIVKTIDEKNNHFMFLINSSFLAFGNAFLGLCFGFLGVFAFPPSILYPYAAQSAGFFSIGYDYISPSGYFFISAILSGFGYILYRISVNSAEDFSLYVRTSFDLYRKNLLRQMDWKPPKTIEAEKELWKNISEYLIAAERFGKVTLPEFEYHEEKTSSKLLTPKSEQEKWPGR
jgi:hypothetical protein